MAAKKKAASKTAKKSAAKASNKTTTKSEALGFIADKTGLTKKDVGAVFDALSMLIKRDLKKNGPLNSHRYSAESIS